MKIAISSENWISLLMQPQEKKKSPSTCMRSSKLATDLLFPNLKEFWQ